MQFQNPFLAGFSSNLPTSQVQENRISVASSDILVFHNDSKIALIEPAHTTSQDHRKRTRTILVVILRLTAMSTVWIARQRGSTASTPLTLTLSRQGFTQSTQICDPLNGDVIYSIKETCRTFPSFEPDLEITWKISGDIPIGTVRYNVFSNEIKSNSTQQTYKNIKHFRSYQLREQRSGSSLRWRVTQRKTRTKRLLNSDGSMTTKITGPLLKLELINPKHMDEHPLCVVSMYTARPVGFIEVYTKSACVNHEGGDWLALDEIILSAYANMDLARQRLMQGSRADANGSMMTGSFDPFAWILK